MKHLTSIIILLVFGSIITAEHSFAEVGVAVEAQKRPFLVVRPRRLDFGEVEEGQKKRRRVTFRNRSKRKKARVRLSGFGGSGYSVSKRRFRLKPGEKRRVRITLRANDNAINSAGQAMVVINCNDPAMDNSEIELQADIKIISLVDLVIKVDQVWDVTDGYYQIRAEVHGNLLVKLDKNGMAKDSNELTITIKGGTPDGGCSVGGRGDTVIKYEVIKMDTSYHIVINESWTNIGTVCCGDHCIPTALPLFNPDGSDFIFTLEIGQYKLYDYPDLKPGYGYLKYTLLDPANP